jgi:CRP-like cAMP-binding protein
MKRTSSIRAKTACSLYSLSRTDLDTILEVYPEMGEKLLKTAEERLTQDLQRNIAKIGDDEQDF